MIEALVIWNVVITIAVIYLVIKVGRTNKGLREKQDKTIIFGSRK